MTRLITNEEIAERFSLDDYLPVAERMYRQLGRGKAASTPRQTTVSHSEDPREGAAEPAFHVMRTMGGSIKGLGVAAVRLNSDVKHWPERHGRPVQERVPVVDGEYNGWVFLFDTDTGELLAVFPDGLIQPYHVAGGIAIGAKYLAPESAETLGLYGSGHQARSHVRALAAVLDLDDVVVYSPTKAHRNEFASEVGRDIEPTVRAVSDPETVCAEGDVVNCATNSTQPVFQSAWVTEGTHIGFIRPKEVPDDLWQSDKIDTFAISTTDQPALESSTGSGYITESRGAADPWRWFVRDDDPPYPKTDQRPRNPRPIDHEEFSRLPSIVAEDDVGRQNADDITLFAQRGDGVAFAAIGYALYELAEAEDLGTSIQSSRLTQEHVP